MTQSPVTPSSGHTQIQPCRTCLLCVSSWDTPVMVASHKAEPRWEVSTFPDPLPGSTNIPQRTSQIHQPEMETFLPNNSSLEQTLGAPVFSISIRVKGEPRLDAPGPWLEKSLSLSWRVTDRQGERRKHLPKKPNLLGSALLPACTPAPGPGSYSFLPKE